MALKNRQIRFLVINDSEWESETIEETLLTLWRNVSVQRERSNTGALDALSSHPYDVIFYDLGMEADRQGGYATLQKIREMKPGAVLLGTSVHPNAHIHSEYFPHGCVNRIVSTEIGYSPMAKDLQQLLEEYGIYLERKEKP